jgi:hypothetical protein
MIKVKEFHNLPDLSVKQRIDSYFEEIKKRHHQVIDSLAVKWSGNKADVKLDVVGLKIKGKILLDEEEVTVMGELPPVAQEYREQLEDIVKYELNSILY